MPTTLLENQNSNYWEAFGSQYKKDTITVLVYVESHDDIAFWNYILQDYKTDKIKFDIQLPSNDSLVKGKSKALERHTDLLTMGVGKRLIICIDSDYDYLHQDKTEQSRLVNKSNFIFQTYAYSIENLRCFSSSLHHVSVQTTNRSHDKIDFEELMKWYSKSIYPLLLWSIFLENSEDASFMRLTHFCNFIKLGGKLNIYEKGVKHLENLAQRVTNQVHILETTFPHHIENIKSLQQELTELGLNSENAYLFIQGHTLHDDFVLPFLISLFRALKSEELRKIRQQCSHEEERDNALNHYQNSLIEPEKALKTNTEFKACFLYQKIKADLDQFIQTIDI